MKVMKKSERFKTRKKTLRGPRSVGTRVLISLAGGQDFRCSPEDVDATPAIRRHVDVIGDGTGMSLRGTGYPVELKVMKVM